VTEKEAPRGSEYVTSLQMNLIFKLLGNSTVWNMTEKTPLVSSYMGFFLID
jgi:hypothetical protein